MTRKRSMKREVSERFKRKYGDRELPEIVIKRPKGLSNSSFELLNLYAVKLARLQEKLRKETEELRNERFEVYYQVSVGCGKK